MTMPALVTSHSKAREKLRGEARGKKEKAKPTGPKLGVGMSVVKSQKEIAETELRQKVDENEERRRQWLMNWHLEVDQMHTDLWNMEQTLATSMVRTDSAKKRDREKRKDTTAPQMTEEELEKLPVRMRPRPKYKPYMSQKERSDLNFLNFSKVIRNLHDNPRKFDVFTPDDFRPMSNISKLPLIQIGTNETENYKILIRKNPFAKDYERSMMVQRSKTEFLQLPHSPGKPYFKPNVTTRSADSSGKLPSIKLASMPDLRIGVEKQEQEPLPKLDRHESILSPVKERRQQGQVTEKMSLSRSASHSSFIEADLDSVESGESGNMMAIKAKKQQQRTEKSTATLAMPSKNQPNLLEDANFRKTLLQELDGKRQERSFGNKWNFNKNELKATSTALKIKMPDVIKDEAKNKHKNRALDQVKERIKAREGAINKGQSQSMNALDDIGKDSYNRKRRN